MENSLYVKTGVSEDKSFWHTRFSWKLHGVFDDEWDFMIFSFGFRGDSTICIGPSLFSVI